MASGCPVIAWEGSARSVLGESLRVHQSGSGVGSGAIEEVGGEAVLWAPMRKGALGSALEHLQDTTSVHAGRMLVVIAAARVSFCAWRVCLVVECATASTHCWFVAVFVCVCACVHTESGRSLCGLVSNAPASSAIGGLPQTSGSISSTMSFTRDRAKTTTKARDHLFFVFFCAGTRAVYV